jgi:hypothetical protein
MTFKPGRFEGGGMRFLRFTDWLVEIVMHAHGLRVGVSVPSHRAIA